MVRIYINDAPTNLTMKLEKEGAAYFEHKVYLKINIAIIIIFIQIYNKMSD